MYMSVSLHVCLCSTYDSSRDQKKASDSLELVLEMVVCHSMGAGNRIWVLGKKDALLTAESSLQSISVLLIVNDNLIILKLKVVLTFGAIQSLLFAEFVVGFLFVSFPSQS